MADTKIADIVANNLFFPFVQEQSIFKSALIQSSAIVDAPSLLTGLAAGGPTFNFRSWTNITNTAGDYDVSSDDPTSSATPVKTTSEKQIVNRLDRNKAFSVTDLSSHFAGTADPMLSIIGEVGGYRAKQRQKVMLSQLLGVSLKLNDGPDTAVQTLAAITDATRITPETVIDATAPWDDEVPEGLILVVHGDIYRRLKKLNLIDFTPTNVQDVGFGTYLGMTLVVDSTVPKVDGTSDATAYNYTSYVLKPGAMGKGIGSPDVPAEFQREALQADGGGVDYLVIRDAMAFHPIGMSFKGAVSGATPTNAEMEEAADWDTIYERKNIGISYMITNA